MPSTQTPFSVDITPDWEEFIDIIRLKKRPQRVHHIELFLDREIEEEIITRYDVCENIDMDDPFYEQKRRIALQRFLGYDFVRQGVGNVGIDLGGRLKTDDTAELARSGGRGFVNVHSGPIQTWEDFESFHWPAPEEMSTEKLEWYEKNLPDDMCIIGCGGFGHFAEYLMWVMGYERLCFALFDNRDLVDAICERIRDINVHMIEMMLQFDRVKAVWASDDMGFKTGLLISPADLKEFVLAGHAEMAEMAHSAGRPYLLHSCGNLEVLMNYIIEDVSIDAKHSFEDAIEPVTAAKKKYGEDIALLGGIDVDLLCRASTSELRSAVNKTLDICMPGGGYCLGSGNSIANYIPLDNYMTMLDEGRRYMYS